MKSHLAIGLMSGTSADGVSLALAAFTEKNFDLLAYKTYAYPKDIRRFLNSPLDLKSADISRLNFLLGRYYAALVLKFLKKFRIPVKSVSVIGSHGHTLYHGPNDRPGNTLQIGEPSLIAEKTGIPVVADFRPRDIAAGGEGAPLIPFFDQFFFAKDEPVALQNIGGMANVTITGKKQPLIAFDNGPGNCLIDWAVQKLSGGKKRYDEDGKIAARGVIQMPFIWKMMEHPYFRQKPPKSTGRELFNAKFIPRGLLRHSTEDIVATLTYFTAFAIHQSIHDYSPRKPLKMLVSGGGALNRSLLHYLKLLFAPIAVESVEKYGFPAQAKEPVAFAFFALRALQGKSNHWPQGTGGKKTRVLGKIIPGKTAWKIL